MPRKKTVNAGGKDGAQVINLNVGTAAGANDEDEQEHFEQIDREESGALSNALEQLRAVAGAKAEVHRLLPFERAGFCRTYPIGAFSVERVAKDYGPGRYRVRFKGSDDRYLSSGRQPTFEIAEGTEPVSSAGTASSGVQDLLALIKEERAREKEERERKKGEWLEWGKLLVPTLGPAILGMFGQKGPTLPELIAAVKNMNELQGKPNDLTQQFDQVVRILQGAKELVGDDGGKATGSTWVDLIRDVMSSPAVGTLVQSLPIPGAMARPPQPLLASPTAGAPPTTKPAAAPPPSAASTASAPNAAPGSGDGPMFEQLNWLKATVDTLLIQAEKNASPRLYAEVTLDNLPPFMTDQAMLERLNQVNWWDQLKVLDKRVEAFQPWFQRYRDQVIKRILYKQRMAAAAAAAPPQGTPENPLPGFNQPMTDEGGAAHD